MYYINKIVTWTLSPMGVFFLSVLFGWAAWRFAGHRAWVRRACRLLVAFGFVELWVLSCGFSIRFVGCPLEGEEIDVLSLPSADAIVLLGGGIGVHSGCGRPELFCGADRVWTAARLFKAGKAPRMTVSGSGAPGEIAVLADLGVDTNKIVVLESARNTQEEAEMIKVKVGGEGEGEGEKVKVKGEGEGEGEKVKGEGEGEGGRIRILLVTSAWHMPRAKMLFERAGFEVVAAPTDYEMHFASEGRLQVGDFLPGADALASNSYAVKEWVAYFCYWLKDRL